MCKILEDIVTEEHLRIIEGHRKMGRTDEEIAGFLLKPLEYVQKVAPLEATAN